MINLGMIKPERTRSASCMEDVVLSEPLAKEEVDRYTFNAPGQATSYFYGYSKLEALRAKTRDWRSASKFDAQSYHDFIIAQGLLPPDLLEKAVMENYVKPRLALARRAPCSGDPHRRVDLGRPARAAALEVGRGGARWRAAPSGRRPCCARRCGR